jgi:hypothetical protein
VVAALTKSSFRPLVHPILILRTFSYPVLFGAVRLAAIPNDLGWWLMLDLRKEIRAPVNRRGAIKFGAPGQKLPCTVTDLTQHGAGLSLGTTFGIPRVFQLAIDGDASDRHCRVIWANGKKLGVSFE